MGEWSLFISVVATFLSLASFWVAILSIRQANKRFETKLERDEAEGMYSRLNSLERGMASMNERMNGMPSNKEVQELKLAMQAFTGHIDLVSERIANFKDEMARIERVVDRIETHLKSNP